MASALVNKLQVFDSISLEDMNRVALLNRTDTKFVFNQNLLINLIDELSLHYAILEIDNKRTNDYKTVYYDTKDKELYTRHHNGKLNRYKIRFRKYVDSGLCFLEIKFKTNKGRTIKSRQKKGDFEEELSDESKKFIKKKSALKPKKLKQALWNEFTRLTLVHKTNAERLTIDLNLQFEFEGMKNKLENIVIAEVKREGMANSDFINIIKERHITPSGMSKYCIGTALTDGNVKRNNFKEKILHLNKITNGNS